MDSPNKLKELFPEAFSAGSEKLKKAFESLPPERRQVVMMIIYGATNVTESLNGIFLAREFHPIAARAAAYAMESIQAKELPKDWSGAINDVGAMIPSLIEFILKELDTRDREQSGSGTNESAPKGKDIH